MSDRPWRVFSSVTDERGPQPFTFITSYATEEGAAARCARICTHPNERALLVGEDGTRREFHNVGGEVLEMNRAPRPA